MHAAHTDRFHTRKSDLVVAPYILPHRQHTRHHRPTKSRTIGSTSPENQRAIVVHWYGSGRSLLTFHFRRPLRFSSSWLARKHEAKQVQSIDRPQWNMSHRRQANSRSDRGCTEASSCSTDAVRSSQHTLLQQHQQGIITVASRASASSRFERRPGVGSRCFHQSRCRPALCIESEAKTSAPPVVVCSKRV